VANDDNKVNIQLQHKQYREENKEKFKSTKKDYDKKYREKNKELIRMKKTERIECLCGTCYSRDNKAKHERTKKHQDYFKPIQQ
jgi:hypothetical protein